MVNVAPLVVDAPGLIDPTHDELYRWAAGRHVFVSSVLDLTEERTAAIEAIREAGLTPVAWELITPAPVAADTAWLDGVARSQAMVLLLRSRYGVRQRTGYSATHSEFREAEARGLRRWVLIDHRGRADRDGSLVDWVAELSQTHSYTEVGSPVEVRAAVSRAIRRWAAYDRFTWFKLGSLILRADSSRIEPPPDPWFGTRAGQAVISGPLDDARAIGILTSFSQSRTTLPLVIGGQLFDARPTHFTQVTTGGADGFLIELALDAARVVDDAILHMHYSEGGSNWTPIEMAELSARATLGLEAGTRPSLMSRATRVDWAEILAAARGIPELFEIVAQLAVGEVLLRSGALARISSFEVQLVGQPPTVQVLIEGTFAPGQGVAAMPLRVGGTVAQA
jgi:Domain of unknown function (DUF4062)